MPRLGPRRLAAVLLAVAGLGLATGLGGVAAGAPAAGPVKNSKTFVFGTAEVYNSTRGDTYFNTTASNGDIITTSDDSYGTNQACGKHGSDIAILRARGAGPAQLKLSTVNCMTSFGPVGGGTSADGCSWKTGGITRVGGTIYLAVARQLRRCSRGKQANGLQPSFDASIMKSTDGGRTWTNPWGRSSTDGAAPRYEPSVARFRAMFPGRTFSAPFFIQYGPGNTQTADRANKYLYAVSSDGYAYNGNYMILGRVPLNKVQTARAWQFYHGRAGGSGRYWTRSPVHATKLLRIPHGVSQPAIQYVPALRRYVLVTFSYTQGMANFPTPAQTPYTWLRIYTAPHPWGPWTKVYHHSSQRSLWCTELPCTLTTHPGGQQVIVGKPGNWMGFYDPTIVQKFLFTRPLFRQALFTSGDFQNAGRYDGEHLYRLHSFPFNLAGVLRR